MLWLVREYLKTNFHKRYEHNTAHNTWEHNILIII